MIFRVGSLRHHGTGASIPIDSLRSSYYGKGWFFVSEKTYIPSGEQAPASQIGATLEALAATIHARRDAGDESYTHRLLTGKADDPLKKVCEEANEVGLAGKDVEAARAMLAGLAGHEGSHPGMVEAFIKQEDAACDHLRYEAADVVYHLLVVLERYGIEIDEFAAELNNRMTDAERPCGAVRLHEDHVKRGK